MYILSSPFFYCKSEYIIENNLTRAICSKKNYITKGKADLAGGEEHAGC